MSAPDLRLAALRRFSVAITVLNVCGRLWLGFENSWAQMFVALGTAYLVEFVLETDDESVFRRTVDWAIEQGIETATFHILTPYPGTALHQRLWSQNRITTADWDLYDTRHAVFRPARMSASALEAGYWRAYEEFYRWGAIARGAAAHASRIAGLRHFAYAAGWKKFEPLWDLVIRAELAELQRRFDEFRKQFE